MTERNRSLFLILFCQVASMALWFSLSAAVPGLIASHTLTSAHAALLTSSVQLGFVFGTLCSTSLGIADRFDPRRLFSVCSLAGAAVTLPIVLISVNGWLPVGLRFITGVLLAGVYPVGMKMAASWSRGNMGTMIGLLVAALTVGSALPYFFNGVLAGLTFDWRLPLYVASGAAMISAVAIHWVALGPGHSVAARFRPMEAWQQWRRKSLRLANFGYYGHMWELYAMWAWIGTFLSVQLHAMSQGDAYAHHAALLTFIVIGSGAIGSIGAGVLADRIGRTTTTIAAMVVSGTCAVIIGFAPDYGITALIIVSVIWGISVIADSAQFSAAVAELSEPTLVGTMLTMQTCIGFLLTFVAIQAIPFAVDAFGWRHAFTILAIGPYAGAYAMWRLRAEPDALRMANGAR